MRSWMKEHTTGEILVVLVGLTVCGYVVFSAILVLLLAFFTDRDVSDAARNISDIVNTMIGLLAGYMAGRTDVHVREHQDQQKKEGGTDAS